MSNFEKFDLRDGTHIRFTKTGKGEPLVLLHTIRNRLEYFDLVIPYLKDNYTLIQICVVNIIIIFGLKSYVG